jgi:tRNA(Ile)-lysidine synthase
MTSCFIDDSVSILFAQRMLALGPFEQSPHITVALSGGSDSMALCLLADAWAKAKEGRVTALIVDHRLRATSTAEASQVAAWLTARGITAVILPWEHDAAITHNIQESAREARYQLLTDWCQRHHVLHLLLGHQQDDVAEGFMMRALRGSGVRGIATMPALRYHRGVRLLRPLLNHHRAALRAWLTAQNQEWIDDPSNQHPRFQRTHMRQLITQMAENTADATKRLADVAASAAKTQQALDQLALPWLVKYVHLSPLGYATIACEAWKNLPEDITLDLLKRLIRMIGQGEVRFDNLCAVHKRLQTESSLRLTIGGCLLEQSYSKQTQSTLLICREPAQCAPILWPADMPCIRWDHRFLLEKSKPIAMQIRPFCATDRRLFAELDPDGLAKKLQLVPKSALLSIPVLEALDIMPRLPHIYRESSGIRISFQPEEALTRSRIVG